VLDRSEVGEPLLEDDAFEAIDLGHHGVEVGPVQDAEQAREVVPALVVNLERHEA